MKINTLSVAVILLFSGCVHSGQELESFPEIGQEEYRGGFTLAAEGSAATICIDTCDARVVTIAAGLLADDVERLTGFRPQIQTSESLPEGPAVIAGTIGKSFLVDEFSKKGLIDTETLQGKWESYCR